jgi:hypothetical protein
MFYWGGGKIMENMIMSKNQFNTLDDNTKFLINQGNWFLFEVDSSSDPRTHYLLAADDQFYIFDGNKNMIDLMNKRPVDVTYKKIIYFNDIPRPESLSNWRFSWAY